MFPGFRNHLNQKNVEVRVDYELFEKADRPETVDVDETNARME